MCTSVTTNPSHWTSNIHPHFFHPLSSSLTVEKAKLACVKFQAKRLVERALHSPSMEEPANRTSVGLVHQKPDLKRLLGAGQVRMESRKHQTRNQWPIMEWQQPYQNLICSRNVSLMLRPIPPLFSNFTTSTLEDFVRTTSFADHGREQSLEWWTNELDIHMGTQVDAFTSLNCILHQQSVELNYTNHTPNDLGIPLGHLYFTNTAWVAFHQSGICTKQIWYVVEETKKTWSCIFLSWKYRRIYDRYLIESTGIKKRYKINLVVFPETHKHKNWSHCHCLNIIWRNKVH